jgi:hypothetical protein
MIYETNNTTLVIVIFFFNNAFDFSDYKTKYQFIYNSPTNFPTVLANQATIAHMYSEQIPTDSELGYKTHLIEWIAEEGKY